MLLVQPVMIRSDSDLIVKQLDGSYNCRDEKLVPLRNVILKAKARYTRAINFHWVSRDKNTEADALSRTAYDQTELQYFRDNQLDIMFNGDDIPF